MPSYLEKTMALLKRQDFLAEKVEHYNAFSGTRHDLFGFLDIVALHPAHGTIGIQVCGPGDFAAHVAKMTGPRREALAYWLLGGNRCLLVGWKGNTPRAREFTLADLEEFVPEAVARLRRSGREDCPDWLSSIIV